ncbi:hypothetical protein [Methanosarcina sp. WWM596]|uniref:hypothetical protein n=1 Tax=Methanosarcina sp. WWM596 TaxID=1434103 RepID=UPI001E5C395E|nr:hypothetical protein [Methanosarcina sp. WWM596]
MVGMSFSDIFNQLKELEKRFNEIRYPPEATFQPSFSFKVRKAEQDSLQNHLPDFEIDEFFNRVEQ